MAKDRFLAQGVAGTKRQRNGGRPAGSRKPAKDQAKRPGKPRRHHAGSDEEGGDDESDNEVGDVSDLEHRYGTDENDMSSEDEFLETAAEKRLRLAKSYISKVKASTELDADEYDAAQIDRDLIAERLTSDARERSGKWSRRIADQFAYPIDESSMARVLKNGHLLPVTCVAISPNGQFVYSGSKDGSLVKWQRETGRKLKVFKGQKKKNPAPNHSLGHCDHILSIAISSDNKYVATGGRDRRIHIWSVDEDRHLIAFHQHKDAVTGVVFRRGVNHLYSCSADRMVKLWNVDELAYMDTLFGHQDIILSIDALQREQAVTAGSRDKTLRLWKIADEAQLVFRGGSTTDQSRIAKALSEGKQDAIEAAAEVQAITEQNPSTAQHAEEYRDLLRSLAAENTEFCEESVDVVAMIDEETYVTGGDSGALCLWSVQKKKPVFIHHVAHGVQPTTASTDAVSTTAAEDDGDGPSATRLPTRSRWITALAAVPFTDMFFSASSDGLVRLWRMRPGKVPGFDLVNTIPVAGFVNGLAVRELTPEGSLSVRKDIALAVAVGQEPRLGRWAKEKARNVVRLFHLPANPSKSSSS
ncbi:pre-rRNA processing protein [Coemansia sp. BCRC 34962]|nr:pre-rRNA processing protein [Coemansia sp. BCRC 34962]